ncbi:MAG TPA: hypothetical protein VGH76_19090 [Actinomycetospora sp.]|uniref:hypothetical protein n=1 Tax=Actinomycetospora sp. TaxID=1872135 RepID=UPI002F42AE42
MAEEEVDDGNQGRRTPRTRTIRRQTRHNAYIYVDEGEQLFRMAERSGSTIMTALRSAWPGEVLGQSNASAESTRLIPAGSYSMGVVIGIQPVKAGPLFGDTAGGKPVNNVVHLLLTLITFGLWIFVWRAIGITSASQKKTVMLTVDEYGQGMRQDV